jgi:hypothetical protein
LLLDIRIQVSRTGRLERVPADVCCRVDMHLSVRLHESRNQAEAFKPRTEVVTCGLMRVGLGLFLILAGLLSGCQTSECHAGCLCYGSVEDCPAFCYPTYTATGDGGPSRFVCANLPEPKDATAGHE